MALWGKTDTLQDAPKFVAKSISVDASDAAVLDLATDTFTYDGHGLVTGDYVQYRTDGTEPTGLADDEYYYAIRVDADNFRLANTDVNAAANSAVDITGLGTGTDDIVHKAPTNIFFVDLEESQVAANRAKGIRTPGWIRYDTYVDSDTVTRHRVEPLIVMKVAAASSGDDGVTGNTSIEDATVADS